MNICFHCCETSIKGVLVNFSDLIPSCLLFFYFCGSLSHSFEYLHVCLLSRVNLVTKRRGVYVDGCLIFLVASLFLFPFFFSVERTRVSREPKL